MTNLTQKTLAAAALAALAALAPAPAALARMDYAVADLYSLAEDGSRKPIAPRWVKDGRAVFPRHVAHFVQLTDVEPGARYLAIDAGIPGKSGLFVRELHVYVNGRRAQAFRARVPEEGNGAQWITFGPQPLKSGDVVAFLGPDTSMTRLRVLTDRLDGDVVPCVNEFIEGEAFCDLSDAALTPTSLVLRATTRLGRATGLRASYVVTDYWQNELARGALDLTANPTAVKAIPFAANPTGETRAEVRVALRGEEGRTMRRYLTSSHDRTAGRRPRLLLEDGWEGAFWPGDGTPKGRLFREKPPADAKWRPILPHGAFHPRVDGKPVQMAWFRRRLSVPAAFGGMRVVFKAERLESNARIFVNGRLVKSVSHVEYGLPVEADVTDALVPGENEILLAVQGVMSRYEEADLLKDREPAHQDWRLPGGPVNFTDPTLEGRPAVAVVKRPFVETSVTGRTIRVTTETPAGCRATHRVLRQGREVLPRFADGERVLWMNPILWGPEAFPLLELETTLSDAKGNVVDVLSTRFGFREFTTRGMDVLWNGVPYRGYARGACNAFGTYGRVGDGNPGHATRQYMLDRIAVGVEDGARFGRHLRLPEIGYDFCDELGLPSSFNVANCPFGQMEARYLGNDAYWKAKEANDCATVDAYGNHPSLFTWYVSNEFWIINDARAYDLIAPSVKALMRKDPTRFVETGSDLDCRGLTQILSTHYPVASCTHDPATWYPNMFYWRPIDREFAVGKGMPFGQTKTIGNAHGDALIPYGTKPISVHETGWSVNIQRPHGTTRFFGDEGYCGFNTLEAHHMFVNFETFVGQRDANVTMIQPWRGGSDGTSRSMPLLDVQLVERVHALYEGTRVSYQVNVFHDIPKAEALELFYELRGADGRAVRSGGETLRVAGCEGRRTKIAFDVPGPGRYALAYGIRGRLEKTLAVTSSARRGDEAALLRDPRVVAGDRPVTDAMLRKVEAGGSLVLLPRADYPEALPVTLRLTGRNASLNFTFRPDHPALRGIAKEDLSLWYPNHVTGFGYFDKPASGGVKTLVEAGGPKGLIYSALVEIPYGKGTVYATRLDLKPEENPVAAQLLRNLLAIPPAGTCGRGTLGVVGTRLLKPLQAWGIACAAADAKDIAKNDGRFAAFFVDGRDAAAAAALKAAKGVRAIVQDPDPAAWGIRLDGNPAPRWRGNAVKAEADSPELRGLTNYDFFWRKLGLGWGGENPGAINDVSLMVEPLGAAEILGADALLYPRYLARRGGILLSTLNMMASQPPVKPLAERVFTTLVANMGVAVAPSRSLTLPKRLAFTPVDLTGVLNRSFADEVENDGQGGWSDQGPENDLREFTLPAGVHEFGGARYRIERPNSLFAMTSQFRRRGNDYERVRVDMKGQKAPWLFFLNASAWTMKMHCLSVFVEYADGSEYEIQFVGGQNLRGWTEANPESPSGGETDTLTKLAFTVPQAHFGKASVFSTAWKNPAPSKPIRALRFQSLNRPVAMFLAISIGTPVADGAAATGAADGAAFDAEKAKRLYERGAALQRAKDYAGAIRLYERAHAADPRQLNVMNALGNCHDALGEPAKAAAWYRKSLDTDINQPHVLDYLNAAEAKAKGK